MKENKLVIEIDRGVKDVFDFAINPASTSRWIDSIVREEAEFPIGKGTKYKNVNRKGEWMGYVVSVFEPNKQFQMDSLVSDYKVRYTFNSILPNKTELEYFEWSESGLNDPFEQKTLEKLKKILESEK